MKRDRMLGPVQMVLLHLIETETSCYGQALCDRIVTIFGGPFSAAQVYVALNRLQERGLVIEGGLELTKRKGRPRKLYLISPDGAEALNMYRRVAQHILPKSEPVP